MSPLVAFMQAFKLNDAMANFLDPEQTATLYNGAMSLWDAVTEKLKPDFCRLRYENLVENPEAESQRLALFLNVPWTKSGLNVAEKTNDRRNRISTPSYVQVTEPIHGRAVGRWRRFVDDLLPVQPLLSPWIEVFGYLDRND